MSYDQKFNDFFKDKVYRFTLDLIKFVDGLPNTSVVRPIKDQLIRSGTSIGANHTEAQSASSKKDFINFYLYSLKSANESKFWLSLLKDSKKADPKKVDVLLAELEEVSKVLGKVIVKLKGKK